MTVRDEESKHLSAADLADDDILASMMGQEEQNPVIDKIIETEEKPWVETATN